MIICMQVDWTVRAYIEHVLHMYLNMLTCWHLARDRRSGRLTPYEAHIGHTLAIVRHALQHGGAKGCAPYLLLHKVDESLRDA